VLATTEIPDYQTLADDIVSNQARWREWMEAKRPEHEPLPGAPNWLISKVKLAEGIHAEPCRALSAGDWKRMSQFDQLLLCKALRPDRLVAAMTNFVSGTLGGCCAACERSSFLAHFTTANSFLIIFNLNALQGKSMSLVGNSL
jgi:hypothetical protein